MVKAQLIFKIATLLKERDLKQMEAGELFGVQQPIVSRMLRGDFRQFSVERLLRFLVALDQDVDIVVKPHRDKTTPLRCASPDALGIADRRNLTCRTPKAHLSRPCPNCLVLGCIVTVEVLDRLADDLDQESIAKNTRTSYLSDWASWLYFCERHRIKPIPADPADVRRYLTQVGAVGGRKGAKLRPRSAQRHLAAIAAAHRAVGLEFDTQHPILKRTMAGILRRYGARQQGARALRAADIERCARVSVWICDRSATRLYFCSDSRAASAARRLWRSM